VRRGPARRRAVSTMMAGILLFAILATI